jgi:1-acyl-sn-glycerol-3-phosphate acyltransferase
MNRLVLRALWQICAAWIFTAIFLTAAVLVVAALSGRLRSRVRAWFIRSWAGGMLFIVGVRLRVEGAEHLAGRAKRVMTLNHSSLLDAFIALSLLPEGGLPVVKSEILYYPFIGLAARALDVVALPRRHKRRALDILRKVEERMEAEALTVMIAPEGTRSTGSLGVFKLGAFHLAAATRAPVVPMVIIGAEQLQPRGRLHCAAGTVLVRILRPVEPDGWGETIPRAMATELRSIYERELACG